MLNLHLDETSGVAVYVQLQQQVRAAMTTGVLRPGDRLPSAREVVVALGINPNTVLKAYSELRRAGLIVVRQGQGAFVRADLPTVDPAGLAALRSGLQDWVAAAGELGMDRHDMLELFRAEISGDQAPG